MALSMEELSMVHRGLTIVSPTKKMGRYSVAHVGSGEPTHYNSCAPIALAILESRTYKEVNAELIAKGYRASNTTGTTTHHYLFNHPEWHDVTKEFRALGEAMSVAKFAAKTVNSNRRFLVSVRGHVLAVIRGTVYNTIPNGRRAHVYKIYELKRKDAI